MGYTNGHKYPRMAPNYYIDDHSWAFMVIRVLLNALDFELPEIFDIFAMFLDMLITHHSAGMY